MGLFSNKKPILQLEEISNLQKVKDFVEWFLKHENFVTTLLEPSNNTIFNEGYRPLSDERNNPEKITNKITNLEVWFVSKMFIDLNFLKNLSKEEWVNFIDELDKEGEMTLIKSAEIVRKYNLDTEHFIYHREITKITNEKDLVDFKKNFLQDNVLGAEIRILAWLYLNYFNEPYKIVG